jgi:uncharacterized OB-fold protein
MMGPYRERLRRLLRDGEEREVDRVDEELRDIAWNLKEYRKSRMKCRYCGEFYIPQADASEDVYEVCTTCCRMEELDYAEDKGLLG